jgi:hypothetical protein
MGSWNCLATGRTRSLRDLHLHLYMLLMGGKAHMEKENFYAGGPRAAGALPVPASPRDKFAAALLPSRSKRGRLCCLSCLKDSVMRKPRENFANRSHHAFGMRARRAERNSGTRNCIASGKTRPSYLRVVK